MSSVASGQNIDIHGHCDTKFEAVREAFQVDMRENGEVGASVAIVIDGEAVVDLWAGLADRDTQAPWERDTIVNVYSSTKGPAALCLHILADRGLLDLDAPVARYWPEFAQAGKAGVLVKWILTHQAGLPALDGELPAGAALDWDYMVRRLEQQRPLWEPGTKRGYHAITYGWLVGELVRRVSGRRIGAFFQDEIATPLGLDFFIGLPASEDYRTATFIYPEGVGYITPIDMSPTFLDPASVGYRAITGILNPPVCADVNSREWRAAEFPAANGHGNARSLARFYGALACGGELNGVRIISPEAVERAAAVQITLPDEMVMMSALISHQTMGFTRRQLEMPGDPRSAGAFGGGGAGGSLCYADPESSLGFGYAMNRAWRQRLDNPDPRGASLTAAAYRCLRGA